MTSLFRIFCLISVAQPLGQAVERVDYHSIRKQSMVASQGFYEGELHLRTEGKARPQEMRGFGAGWRGGSPVESSRAPPDPSWALASLL
mgnify:CR=1 FL=1